MIFYVDFSAFYVELKILFVELKIADYKEYI